MDTHPNTLAEIDSNIVLSELGGSSEAPLRSGNRNSAISTRNGMRESTVSTSAPHELDTGAMHASAELDVPTFVALPAIEMAGSEISLTSRLDVDDIAHAGDDGQVVESAQEDKTRLENKGQETEALQQSDETRDGKKTCEDQGA